jgi:hypothetical protein
MHYEAGSRINSNSTVPCSTVPWHSLLLPSTALTKEAEAGGAPMPSCSDLGLVSAASECLDTVELALD